MLDPLDPGAVRQLDGFIAKFSDEVAALTHPLFDRMRARIPGATILVYDNYNALALAFGANEKMNGLILSLAVYPRWVTLCFSRGTSLADPHRLLEGVGSKIRHVRLFTADALDDPQVDALIAEALDLAEPPVDATGAQRLIIKAISAKQRPRRL